MSYLMFWCYCQNSYKHEETMQFTAHLDSQEQVYYLNNSYLMVLQLCVISMPDIHNIQWSDLLRVW